MDLWGDRLRKYCKDNEYQILVAMYEKLDMKHQLTLEENRTLGRRVHTQRLEIGYLLNERDTLHNTAWKNRKEIEKLEQEIRELKEKSEEKDKRIFILEQRVDFFERKGVWE